MGKSSSVLFFFVTSVISLYRSITVLGTSTKGSFKSVKHLCQVSMDGLATECFSKGIQENSYTGVLLIKFHLFNQKIKLQIALVIWIRLRILMTMKLQLHCLLLFSIPLELEQRRLTKIRWKCALKDGIMQLNNKDILFSKAIEGWSW
jgi:hypothetical protein